MNSTDDLPTLDADCPVGMHRTARVIDYCCAHVDEQPGVQELAQRFAVSADVLSRDFKRFVGIPPKTFLQHLTAQRSVGLLDRGLDVLQVSLAVGLSGPSRLHDHMLRVYALSPGEWKRQAAGLTIRYGVCDSAWGLLAVALTQRGVHRLAFLDDRSTEAGFLEGLRRQCGQAELHRDDDSAAEVITSIFAAERRHLHLDLVATPFQLAVWSALIRLPAGKSCSYGGLARHVQRPSAVRAVAGAVAANPVAVLIPCHRVLSQQGALHGYRWGLGRKLSLLASEQPGA